MKKLLVVLFCAAASTAQAANSSVNYTSSGSSGIRTTTDGTTNCTGSTACNLPNNTIWDYSTGANGWSIDSGHGGLIAGEGTAGTATGGVLTVQGVASMTPFLTNPGTAANWAIGATGSSVPANGSYTGLSNSGTLIGWIGDSSGRGIVAGAGTAGTAAGGVLTVQGVASMTPFLANPGTAANWGVGATGSSVPANAVYTGLNNSGNSIGWIGDSSGRGIVAGAGTAGTATGGVLTVQGVASMTPVQVSQATASSLNATVVQSTASSLNATVTGGGTAGSPASGVVSVQGIGSMTPFLVNPGTIATWGLMAGTGVGTAPTNTLITGGIYNSSAPSPLTGQTLPFQLDSSGNLQVNVKAGGGSGGTSSNFSATFPGTGTALGAEYLSSTPTYTSGQMVALQTTQAGSLHTTVDNTNANGAAAASASSPVTPANLPVGAATLATGQVSVASTATQIVGARTGVSGTGRVSLTICNTSTTAVYIGTSGVTTSTGQFLVGIAGACLTLNTQTAVYGIVSTGTETVSFSESY